MIQKIFSEKPDLPNRFSQEIGERIRKGRNEKGITQAELAKQVYKRRASLSEMENGKMYPDIFTMTLIANRLEKPIDYFIPEIYRKAQPLQEGELSNLEKELIAQFRQIWDRQTKELLIRQVKAAANATDM